MDEMQAQQFDGLEENIGPLVRNFPSNCWWVAAAASDVSEKPLARTLLQKQLVLFRTSDGQPHAFVDRCPHRWAPLSRGRVIQNEIVCAYHGFRYDMKGQCTLAPSMRQPPRALRIVTYPTMERGPFIWVWMGDPERADPALLPAITWYRQHSDIRITGYRVTNCDFSLIHENIADTEHTRYLHGESFGNTARIGKGKSHGVMDVESQKITFLSTSKGMPSSKLDRALLGLEEDENTDVTTTAIFTAPGCFSSEFEYKPSVLRVGVIDRVRLFYLWCSTPITTNSCHFWWDLTFDHAHSGRKVVDDMWAQALEEDIDIVEGVQKTVDWSYRDGVTTDSLVGADRAVGVMRRLLKKMLESDSAN